MHRPLGVALSVALLTITLGACSGDSSEGAAEEAASSVGSVATTVAPTSTAQAATTTTVAPTTTTTMADPDNLILLTANVAGASEPIKVEVLAGEFKLVSGMTAREGSSFSVQESWMELTPGLCMDIGPGGLELFGERYEAGTRLLVRSSGNLEVLGAAAAPAGEQAASVAEVESPEFCSLYAEIIDTVVPDFASPEEESAWRQEHQLRYDELAALAPADIKAETQAVADWYREFVALLRASDWDFSALMDDPEASASMDVLLQEGNLPFEAVDAYVADHCGGGAPPPAVAAPDSDLPSFSEVIAEHWPGEPLCDTQAGISGGPDMFMFGPFGDEESLMSMRQGYAMGFCPGSRYIVTGELTVADGSDYPIGTLLTLDGDLNFVAVSSWE